MYHALRFGALRASRRHSTPHTPSNLSFLNLAGGKQHDGALGWNPGKETPRFTPRSAVTRSVQSRSVFPDLALEFLRWPDGDAGPRLVPWGLSLPLSAPGPRPAGHAAQHTHPKCHLYLTLGDHLPQIISGTYVVRGLDCYL